MIPPKAPASTTLRNARTYALRDGSPAGTSESPGSAESSPPPLLAGSSSIAGIVRRSTARQPCACHTDHMAETVREWLGAGALGEAGGRLLFLRNQRRGRSADGMIERCHPWVGEPIAEWLAEQWGPDSVRRYSYEVRGTARADFEVTRTDRNGAVRD